MCFVQKFPESKGVHLGKFAHVKPATNTRIRVLWGCVLLWRFVYGSEHRRVARILQRNSCIETRTCQVLYRACNIAEKGKHRSLKAEYESILRLRDVLLQYSVLGEMQIGHRRIQRRSWFEPRCLLLLEGIVHGC